MPANVMTTQETSMNNEDMPADDRPAFYPPKIPLRTDPPVKVTILGAGLGGIITAILLSHKVRNLEYIILDRNERVGGTWVSNTYPGVRCDIPSHCYQTTFAPNPNWSEFYARGCEIQQYYEDLADRYNVRPNIRFRREVLEAQWRPRHSVWQLEIRDLASNETYMETSQFFINAQGRLNQPNHPDIPGLWTCFSGIVMHTAEWNHDVDLKGKRVAIIGNGASGQQVLPNILPQVAHIDHYVRSRVWITPSLVKNSLRADATNPGARQYSEEERRRFAHDPESYLAYRRSVEVKLHERFESTIMGSPENEKLREACIETMSQRLNGSKEWLDKLVPGFAPGCKRLTPATGYLEALQDDKVTYIQDKIVRVSERGLVAADGTEREVDIIITATGFKNGFIPRFPMIGRDGINIASDWADDGTVGYPETYFGVMAPDMPNYFFILQAQSNGGGGSVPLHCEISAAYIAKVIRKVQLERHLSITPSRQAVEEFNDLCLGYFEDKVVSDTCSSWLKTGGDHGDSSSSNSSSSSGNNDTRKKRPPRTVVWWPGSGHHRMEICRNPRWEDFEYERAREARGNRYAYFGSGWTEREKEGGVERLTSYLKTEDKMDIARLHEDWNE